jgi:catechol 2,3-dioxygenase-like lactoylglutathione lyase family enzyme
MNILKPHVSLNVSSVDASVAFYEKAFGVSATKRRPGYAKFDLAEPSLNLSMQEAPRTGLGGGCLPKAPGDGNCCG